MAKSTVQQLKGRVSDNKKNVMNQKKDELNQLFYCHMYIFVL